MDLNAFEKAVLNHRTAAVPVPQLAEWYPNLKDGETPTWTVRGLTASEMGWVNENQSRAEGLAALAKAMAGEGDKGEALREFLALDAKTVPKSTSRQIDLLCVGSVDPVLGDNKRAIAVKLAEKFPGTFLMLVNKINELTGLGAEPGKPTRSGKTPASGSA